MGFFDNKKSAPTAPVTSAPTVKPVVPPVTAPKTATPIAPVVVAEAPKVAKHIGISNSIEASKSAIIGKLQNILSTVKTGQGIPAANKSVNKAKSLEQFLSTTAKEVDDFTAEAAKLVDAIESCLF
jgi:hypothetical protein